MITYGDEDHFLVGRLSSLGLVHNVVINEHLQRIQSHATEVGRRSSSSSGTRRCGATRSLPGERCAHRRRLALPLFGPRGLGQSSPSRSSANAASLAEHLEAFAKPR